MGTSRRKQIQKSLTEQLQRKNADVYHFEKLVEDYCELYELKNSLNEKISEQGIMVKNISSTGIEQMKPNPCIAERVRVSAQMLKILSAMDITPSSTIIDGDDEL